MLADGWIPDSREPSLISLVSIVIDTDSALLDSAKEMVQEFLVDDHRRTYSIMECQSEIAREYHTANTHESVALADSCLSPSLLSIQS